MKKWTSLLLVENWQRKLIAFSLALFIWILVNHTTTVETTLPRVPIRIASIPSGKKIIGLNENGFLEQTVDLKLTGYKKGLEGLKSGDIEVLLNLGQKTGDWIVTIRKTELVPHNTKMDPLSSIVSITHDPFIIKIRPQ